MAAEKECEKDKGKRTIWQRGGGHEANGSRQYLNDTISRSTKDNAKRKKKRKACGGVEDIVLHAAVRGTVDPEAELEVVVDARVQCNCTVANLIDPCRQ